MVYSYYKEDSSAKTPYIYPEAQVCFSSAKTLRKAIVDVTQFHQTTQA